MVTLVKGEFPRCQEFLLSSRTGVWGSPLIGVPGVGRFLPAVPEQRGLVGGQAPSLGETSNAYESHHPKYTQSSIAFCCNPD